ncbi:MAG TPA: protein kinase [Vicinamibacterales bacterium]|nr:protein kinase [Vicinamibacterales bacterium]
MTRLEGALTALPGGLRDPDTTGLPPLSRGAHDAVTGVGELPTEFGVGSKSIGPSPDLDIPTSIGTAALKHPVRLDAEASEAVTHVPGQTPSPSDDQSGPLAIGERFGSRYRITRLLGLGGMGAVYEAWDAELGVSVALKVVRPEIAGDSTSAHDLERRFKRELLLARQVTHKNVVRIHDLGEINGIKYITMPYIEGQDLGTILKTEGRLPIPRALSIARQALSGLVAAHAEGIVHRDLKPANIMVDTADQALLMDFGIARSIDLPADQITAGPRRTRPGTFGETMVGAVVGTINYMAPEQARGQPVDHRADIYAFGLILRDMIVGADRGMGAPTALAELQRRLDEAPPSLRTIDPAVPESLDRVVSRCLAPEAAERYQTTIDLETDLNHLDENGEPIPIKRVVGLKMFAGVVASVVALLTGVWWFTRPVPPPKPHDPVSVLIADFQNQTADPAFDRTLEPVLKLALEGAEFISAYDRVGMRTLGVAPPAQLTEQVAQEIAVKQAVGVVLSGMLIRDGNSYELSVKASQAVTGTVIATVTQTAAGKDNVLDVATRAATSIRRALGDNTSDEAQRFAMDTLSAKNLDAVHDYALGQEALSNNKNEEAIEHYTKAIAKDSGFGAAYTGLALASGNVGRQQDAEKYAKEATRHLDSMTEREQYRTRGTVFRVTGDYPKCVEEYGSLVTRFAADAAARNQLALCMSYLRQFGPARSEMQRAAEILPRRALYRINLALYAAYDSDFTAGEAEARTAQELSPSSEYGFVALAFAQLGQNQMQPAADTYGNLSKISALGASLSASGLADIALYEGRFADAASMFEKGAAADLAAKNSDRAAAKLAALSYTRLLQKQPGQAVAAARKALANSQIVKIRFLAARTFIEAGDPAEARKLADSLGAEFQTEPQALAKVLEGEIALKNGQPREAIKLLTEANGMLDTWIGRFDLGRAYLDAGAPTQADAEFDRCIRRRGEALALLLDEEPTLGYFPPVYYYQGRVREEMKTARFVDSYKLYLDIRGQASQDPLLSEVRRRAVQ